MFCKNCGNEVSEEDKFCKNCGKLIKEENQKQTNTEELSMKWYKFLIYFRYPLGMFLGIINLFNSYRTIYLSGIKVPEIVTVFYIVDIISVLFVIFAFYELIEKKKNAPTYFIICETTTIAINSITSAYQYNGTNTLSFFITFLIYFAIFLGIWIYPNYLYINKRKDYFIE